MKGKFDDPKWLAYVLDELDSTERTEIERQLADDPEARRHIEHLGEFAETLKSEFAKEPSVTLVSEVRDEILSQTTTTSREKGWSILSAAWLSNNLGKVAAVLVVGAMLVLFGHMALFKPSRQGEAAGVEEVRDAPAKPIVGTIPEPPPFKLPEEWEEEATADVEIQQVEVDADDVEIETLEPEMNRVEIPVTSPLSIRHNNSALRMPALYGMRSGSGRVPSAIIDLTLSSPLYGPSLDDFEEIREEGFRRVTDHPLSTFSIDVDTASYSIVRRFLNEGRMPPRDAVRIEELVNYFPYDYAPPTGNDAFAARFEMAVSPWNPARHLVMIGIKGRDIDRAKRPPSNLVFLIDVSGSMEQPNRLPLVKRAMQALTQQLDELDHVAIVVYAGSSGLVLPSTNGVDKTKVLSVLERLKAGGSTAGAAGIQLAYQVAREHFNPAANNRVILCTDGDFNVGVINRSDLTRMIETEAKSGVFLTILGFGMGNYKDSTLESLSNRGNGTYAYINDFSEARKVLVDQMAGTLFTIAKDVKIQVEFNPARVSAYRLIGYENRRLNKEDFNNDKVDAGDIGAGHTVTAFYEVVPVGGESAADIPDLKAPAVDRLRYQRPAAALGNDGELLTVKIRYKQPDGDTSRKLEFPLAANALTDKSASAEFRFAAAVAGFGMLLRGSEDLGSFSYDQVLNLADSALGEDKFGYRREFLNLVRNAKSVSGK